MKKIILASIVFLYPVIALGAIDCSATPETVNAIFICFAVGNMSGFIPVLVLVAVVTFLSGVVRFVSAGDNEEKRQGGRQVMIYGIIVLFVMMSLWGFVKIVSATFLDEKYYGMPNYLPKLK